MAYDNDEIQEIYRNLAGKERLKIIAKYILQGQSGAKGTIEAYAKNLQLAELEKLKEQLSEWEQDTGDILYSVLDEKQKEQFKDILIIISDGMTLKGNPIKEQETRKPAITPQQQHQSKPLPAQPTVAPANTNYQETNKKVIENIREQKDKIWGLTPRGSNRKFALEKIIDEIEKNVDKPLDFNELEKSVSKSLLGKEKERFDDVIQSSNEYKVMKSWIIDSILNAPQSPDRGSRPS